METKFCKKCNTEKLIQEFANSCWCKSCKKQYNKQYYIEDYSVMDICRRYGIEE